MASARDGKRLTLAWALLSLHQAFALMSEQKVNKRKQPVTGTKPHVLLILFDDYGWASAGWHRNYTMNGLHIPASQEVQTANLDALVRDGIELDRVYVGQSCSPTRSAVQSGRSPPLVNVENSRMDRANPKDPISGAAGIPRHMTGIAEKFVSAGYRTAMFGKWDAGMASPDHIPSGRGYQSGLWYYHHQNDHWSMTCETCDGVQVTDLWVKDYKSNFLEVKSYHGSAAAAYAGICKDNNGWHVGSTPQLCEPGPLGDTWWGGYEDSLFQRELISLIDEHNDTQTPLFMFWAPHFGHAPLSAPKAYIDKFKFISNSGTDTGLDERTAYAAMLNFADETVGNVTKALQRKGMWDNTLIVFMADNGAALDGGGNNYPLKGGKYQNWEGGIRVPAFVSGGVVPAVMRGTKYNGMITAWDWYATLGAFAGFSIHDKKAKQAGLPQPDSIDVSSVILGTNKDCKNEICGKPRLSHALFANTLVGSDLRSAKSCKSFFGVSLLAVETHNQELYDNLRASGMDIEQALTTSEHPELSELLKNGGNCSIVIGAIVERSDGLWKLLTGPQALDFDQGPQFPNRTAQNPTARRYERDCGHGCLFELHADRFEQHDLASERPDVVDELREVAAKSDEVAFFPNRGKKDPRACEKAKERGYYWGPFLE